MKFIYDATLTKSVVQRYFKEYEDIDGELEIKSDIRKVRISSRGTAEREYAYVSFILKGTMEFEGVKQPVELDINEKEIKNAFTTMISATDRKVKNISMVCNENGFSHIAVEAIAKRKVK